MKKIYLYPLSARLKTGIYNPYMDDLEQALSNIYHVINAKKHSRTGIADILIYLHKTNIIYFNWIEDLPDKKYGSLQTYGLFVLLHFFKWLNINIIWTFHNKHPHNNIKIHLKHRIKNRLIKKADIIITHSRDARCHLIQYGCNPSKIQTIHHPIKNNLHKLTDQKKTIDILIWGVIAPHKETDEFLKLLHDNGLQNRYHILLAGKVVNEDYYKLLTTYLNKHIRLLNKYLDLQELEDLFSKSKIVLFCVPSQLVSGSGVLMDSLSYGVKIIGPDSGAFADLVNENLIYTYNNFDDLLLQLDAVINKKGIHPLNSPETFIKNNTWTEFQRKLSKAVNDL